MDILEPDFFISFSAFFSMRFFLESLGLQREKGAAQMIS
jgi:hypothetical protein